MQAFSIIISLNSKAVWRLGHFRLWNWYLAANNTRLCAKQSLLPYYRISVNNVALPKFCDSLPSDVMEFGFMLENESLIVVVAAV